MKIDIEFFDKYRKKIENRKDWDSNHIREMMNIIPSFPPEKVEKAMRWVGFIQGWFWSKELFTIDEMKDHNR